MLKEYKRQEEWVRYAYAAKALGGSAWELAKLPEPERSFWFLRGLMLNQEENAAFTEDQLDRDIEASIR